MPRKTRSGAVFSPFALQPAIHCDVDLSDLLHLRFAELDAQNNVDASDEELEIPPEPLDLPRTPLRSTSTSAASSPTIVSLKNPPPACSSTPPTPKQTLPNARQKNSHSRRRQKRKAAPTSPVEKPVHATHRAQASARTVLVDFDAADLPANASGFGGLRQTLAKDSRSAESLCAQPGWRYIARPTEGGAVPILDRNRRMMVLIAGSPQELERWKAEVVGPLEEIIASGTTGLSFTTAQLNHTRGNGFAAVASGPSHGGGEKRPANRALSQPARTFMDGLLSHPAMLRATGFMDQLFRTYNIKMYESYKRHQAELHAHETHLRRNFPNSVWSSVTVNMGPRTITDPHVDGANRPDGWCPVFPLGSFNPRTGGHLVLPDLKLVIEFPAGCVIFLPSSLLVHYNMPIQLHEKCYSITQYTAGGLFRWASNGFQTQDTFLAKASHGVKSKWLADRATRWERGLDFFPIIV